MKTLLALGFLITTFVLTVVCQAWLMLSPGTRDHFLNPFFQRSLMQVVKMNRQRTLLTNHLLIQILLLGSIPLIAAFVTTKPHRLAFSIIPQQSISLRKHVSTRKTTTSTTQLHADLWERLHIQEDNEPYWYLLNCVAGKERSLLHQARVVCADMPDAVKFVVPTERITRSHGKNRMVTEEKVKYLGYVFGKLRLCKPVYEALQQLDLCRSWMGTANQKRNKKMPAAPIPLNDLEVEKFGLEAIDDSEEEVVAEPQNGDVILDSMDDDEDDEKKGPTHEEQIVKNVYLGLKVDDMVKVTKKCNFFDEDAIVRRLKGGRIFVRFYTYGTMYEEWLDPADVRKLSNIEILKGLSGPSQPITQQDVDRRGSDRRPSGLSGPPQRNRRQDQTERRYSYKSRDLFGRSEDEKDRADRNWRGYQEEQQRARRGVAPGTVVVQDKDGRSIRSNSRAQTMDATNFAEGDVDSQWGRQAQRQQRQDKNIKVDKRQATSYTGKDDWSALISTGSGAKTDLAKTNDFFDTLVNDLSNDLKSNKSPPPAPKTARDKADEDDFFASLMSDLTDTDERVQSATIQSQNDSDDDFFASLERELDNSLENNDASPDDTRSSSEENDFAVAVEAVRLLSEPIDISTEASPGIESNELPTETAGPISKRFNSVASSPTNNADLTQMSVPTLKDMLRDKGMKVSGKKAELIERLQTSTN
jgi:transcription antitermination factor NusG